MLQALDGLNLFWPNVVVTFISAAFAAWLAAMLRIDGEVGHRECFGVRWGSRVALIGYALIEFQSLRESIATGWQPSGWDFLGRCAILLYMVVGVAAPHLSPRMPGRHRRHHQVGQ